MLHLQRDGGLTPGRAEEFPTPHLPAWRWVRLRTKSAVGSEETGARYWIQRNQIAPSGGIRKVTDAGWPCHT
jgi:hypothetical protein